MTDLHDWLSLYLAPGLGNILMARLLAAYGEPAAVFQASPKDLCQVPGIGKKVAQAINASTLRHAADQELVKAAQENVTILPLSDSRYPEFLRHIYSPPAILYVKGQIDLLTTTCVAMVGSRAATVYGKKIAYLISMTRLGKTSFGLWQLNLRHAPFLGLDKKRFEHLLKEDKEGGIYTQDGTTNNDQA